MRIRKKSRRAKQNVKKESKVISSG
jgi:hypothetical protein